MVGQGAAFLCRRSRGSCVSWRRVRGREGRGDPTVTIWRTWPLGSDRPEAEFGSVNLPVLTGRKSLNNIIWKALSQHRSWRVVEIQYVEIIIIVTEEQVGELIAMWCADNPSACSMVVGQSGRWTDKSKACARTALPSSLSQGIEENTSVVFMLIQDNSIPKKTFIYLLASSNAFIYGEWACTS